MGAVVGPNGMEKKGPSPSRKPSDFRLDLTILTEIDRGLDPNIKLVRVPPVSTWDRGVLIRNGPITTRRPPLAPKVDRTDISSGDTSACQRPPIGDSLNDEEWSDDLQSYQTTMFEDRRVLGKKART